MNGGTLLKRKRKECEKKKKITSSLPQGCSWLCASSFEKKEGVNLVSLLHMI